MHSHGPSAGASSHVFAVDVVTGRKVWRINLKVFADATAAARALDNRRACGVLAGATAVACVFDGMRYQWAAAQDFDRFGGQGPLPPRHAQWMAGSRSLQQFPERLSATGPWWLSATVQRRLIATRRCRLLHHLLLSAQSMHPRVLSCHYSSTCPISR
eukprot:364600-Chlamydomonas_euryale.AAC.2